jgi:hypothetical protein
MAMFHTLRQWNFFCSKMMKVEIDEQLMKILPRKPMENILEQQVIASRDLRIDQ